MGQITRNLDFGLWQSAAHSKGIVTQNLSLGNMNLHGRWRGKAGVNGRKPRVSSVLGLRAAKNMGAHFGEPMGR